MMHEKIAEAFPPGEFIMDELEARGWSQIALADIIGCHPTIVNAWIKGKRAITPQSAKQLGDAFGTSAQLWLNHQSTYDLWKAEEADSGIAKRARLYNYAPIKELTKRHWLQPSESNDVVEQRVKEFYGVPNLDENHVYSYAASKSTPGPLSQAQSAWFCRARQLAKCIPANRFTDQSFDNAIKALKGMLVNVEDIRRIPQTFAEYGIRFLIIEQLLPASGIDGVTFWRDNDKHSPVIAMSLRKDRIDSFWFVLAHELGHVKNRDGLNQTVTLDINLVGDQAQRFEDKSDIEKGADAFAEDFLLPREKLDSFISRKGPLFSKAKIANFASVQKIHPGIVVGQMHYRSCFHYSYYRQWLEKVRHIISASALTDGWGQTPPAGI